MFISTTTLAHMSEGQLMGLIELAHRELFATDPGTPERANALGMLENIIRQLNYLRSYEYRQAVGAGPGG